MTSSPKIKPFQWVTSDEKAEVKELPKDDAWKIVVPGVTLVAGMTESGKTNLALGLLAKNAHQFHKLKILCPTASLQGVFDKIVKPIDMISSPDGMISCINTIIEEQKTLISREKSMGYSIENGPKRKVMLMIDDFIGHLKLRDSPIFNILATSGRQYGIGCIFLTQDIMKIGTTIRDNSRTLYITGVKSHNLDEIFRMQTWFSNAKECIDFVKKNTQNHQVVRFNLTGSGSQEPMIFGNQRVGKITFR